VQPTGRGAPPYDDSAGAASTRSVKIRTRYPELGLSFRLPPMAGSDRLPVSAFVKYQMLATRALRTNHLPPQLRSVASKGVRAQLANWLATSEKYGITQAGKVHVDIRSVSTTTYAAITLCYRDSRTYRTSSGLSDQPDDARSLGVIVGRRKSGNWIVSAMGANKAKLRNC